MDKYYKRIKIKNIASISVHVLSTQHTNVSQDSKAYYLYLCLNRAQRKVLFTNNKSSSDVGLVECNLFCSFTPCLFGVTVTDIKDVWETHRISNKEIWASSDIIQYTLSLFL